jgi:hypothetical protein
MAGAIDGLSGIRAKGFIDDITNPPEAQVSTREFDPRMVLSSVKATVPFTVRVFVKRTDLRSAHKALRGFMEPSGSGSVSAAINNESAWSGATVDDAYVTLVGQPFEYVPDGGNTVYLCVDFDVEVIW